ncbi:hypothetical protein [Streptomyces sp. NBC_00986]|uniref:hypothetical protein n=1 Tax=Streptomyces sp. NBC_00986 TaxID=2903702 RepID=UPI00387046E2|nr:hypothetical protein OG504_01760 [Streptomyces sp. NBC_00986]
MRGQFTGWPEQAMDVLWQLQGEPTHATRERYRADRERLVRQPMIALLNEVADTDPRYEDFSVWHYRTDSWWWQHQGAVIRLGRKIEIGLRFDLDGLRIQGAWWYPDPGQVDMFRKAVASDWTACGSRAPGGTPIPARWTCSAKPSPPREAVANCPPSSMTYGRRATTSPGT